MAGRIILDACNPALDSNGNPDPDAVLTFYENGTTTLQSIYADIDLNTPLTNPLSPNAAGQFPVIWCEDEDVFSVKWEAGNGDIVTFDDIGALVNYTPPTTTGGPMFSVINSANQSIAASVATEVTFGTELQDTHNAYSANTYTVPVGWAGFHDFMGKVFAAATGPIGNAYALVSINSGARTYIFGSTQVYGGSSIAFTLAQRIELEEGDEVKIIGLITGSGSERFNGTSGAFCSFSGSWVAAS